MSAVTEDDVVLLRAGSGTIHMGVPLGRGFDTMCCHMVDSPHVRAWSDRTVPTAEAVIERSSAYLCAECVEVSARPWSTIRRITGW